MPSTQALQQRIVIVGDSITATKKDGSGNGVDWYTPMAQSITASYRRSLGSISRTYGANAAVMPTTQDIGAPTFINSGVAGNQCGDVLLAMNSRIYTYNPTGVIVELGVNDVTSQNNTNADWRTGITDIVAGIRANCALCQWILWVGPICAGEKYPFGGNAFDTNGLTGDAQFGFLREHDTILRERASTLAFEMVEFRNGAGTNGGNGLWLTYQQANQDGTHASGPPGDGAYTAGLTIDGRHLTTAGATFVSNAVLSHMTISG